MAPPSEHSELGGGIILKCGTAALICDVWSAAVPAAAFLTRRDRMIIARSLPGAGNENLNNSLVP